MKQPSMLLVTPIVPAPGGNGLAMRAGVFLDALARDFDVTLLVLPVAGGPQQATPFVAQRTQRAIVVPLADKIDPLWDLAARVLDPVERVRALVDYPRPALCRYATTPCLRAVTAALVAERFDALHVMRLYLAPYVWPLLALPWRGRAFASLDLDDDEPSTHGRLAQLHQQADRPDDARIELAEARKYKALAREALPRFQRIISCARIPGCETQLVPNTVALPALQRVTARPTRRLLFVGNLSYLPNAEGIVAFATKVLPTIRHTLGSRVVLRIAGSAPSAEVLALAEVPGVTIIPNPPELASHYEWADVVVVPLRAGGGTRIKVLEAFAHGVPVVSTTIGAEGIGAVDGEHLLLADTTEALVRACVALLTDRPHASAMAQRARRLVAARYSHARGRAAVRAVLATPVRRRA